MKAFRTRHATLTLLGAAGAGAVGALATTAVLFGSLPAGIMAGVAGAIATMLVAVVGLERAPR
jgi:hypothetical protein